MRVLLDECLPRRLKRELASHDVRTAPEMGWASKRNGELLRLAEHEFDVFVTADRKLQFQQVCGIRDAVIVLLARSNTLRDLRPLMPEVVKLLQAVRAGVATTVGGPL